MRLILQGIRILTGIIFIFSGLVKLNDPWGTAYKLEEYFEVFAQDFTPFFYNLIPYALAFAFFVIVLEVVLGFAALIGYRLKWTLGALLGLVVFFTFLTFYSAYFNKVTDCGCFGDFLKISPWQSFGKDVFLLAMILLLVFNINKIKPLLAGKAGDLSIVGALLLTVYIGYYSLANLPFFDFRPYSVGSNIADNMKAQEAPKGVYIMSKGGKEYQFDYYPSDDSYEFVNYVIKNKDKSTPKITDYRIWNDEGDFTETSFQGVKLLLIVKEANQMQDKARVVSALEQIAALSKELEGAGVGTWLVTSSVEEEIEALRHFAQLSMPVFYADGTVLKTMVRSDPGLILLKDGTVKGKWHFNNVPDTSEIHKLLD
ncbi:DoxX family protein [Cytophagaceae bacterium ABcell3]|nr:DoxX family protein [Cytophagaceae bacterium ABcell3]